MADVKVACWNVFFSHNLVERRSGRLRITPNERQRADTVATIIQSIRADVLGIVECMSAAELRYFVDEKLSGS